MKAIIVFFLAISVSYASVDGFFLPLQDVQADHSYLGSPATMALERYILELSSTPHAMDIAEVVTKTAACFKLSPILFLSLIEQESTFKPQAISTTGAAGLTQMTGSGLDELKDQFGVRGEKYARSSVINYFRTQALNCLGTFQLSKIQILLHKDNSTIKEHLKKDITLSVWLGGALLKVYLAAKQTTDIHEAYRLALEAYNGGKNKDVYASEILSRALELDKKLK